MTGKCLEGGYCSQVISPQGYYAANWYKPPAESETRHGVTPSEEHSDWPVRSVKVITIYIYQHFQDECEKKGMVNNLQPKG